MYEVCEVVFICISLFVFVGTGLVQERWQCSCLSVVVLMMLFFLWHKYWFSYMYVYRGVWIALYVR